MKSSKFLFVILLVFLLISSCQTVPGTTSYPAGFVKGADVSWTPQMEAAGFVFRDKSGQPGDLLKIIKDAGVDTIRLRTWVNPSPTDALSGHCSEAETVAMAVRAKNLGFRLLLDLHYSDTWADPAHQTTPKAWQDDSFPQLVQHVTDYTRHVLKALAAAGVSPEWVQVGNEIDPGMMLPQGARTDMGRLASLIDAGYDAVKEVCPDALVIVHVSQGTNTDFCRAFFDGLTAHQAKYDVVGLSYYTGWDAKRGDFYSDLHNLSANMRNLSKRFGKPVMVVETGGEDSHPFESRRRLQDTFETVRDAGGLGVLYWEPEGAASWSHYSKSAWNADGRPNMAMEAF